MAFIGCGLRLARFSFRVIPAHTILYLGLRTLLDLDRKTAKAPADGAIKDQLCRLDTCGAGAGCLPGQ